MALRNADARDDGSGRAVSAGDWGIVRVEMHRALELLETLLFSLVPVVILASWHWRRAGSAVASVAGTGG